MRKTHSSRASRKRETPEGAIQRVLLARLNCIPGVWVWRSNTGCMRREDRFVKFGKTGQADISGLIRGGRRLEIEVKSANEVQSSKQIEFQTKIEELGGLYLVARDIEKTIAVVQAAVPSEAMLEAGEEAVWAAGVAQ